MSFQSSSSNFCLAQGSALNFAGINDHVVVPNPIGNVFTIEAWDRTSVNSLSGTHAYEGNGLIWSDVAGWASNDFSIGLVNNRRYLEDDAIKAFKLMNS